MSGRRSSAQSCDKGSAAQEYSTEDSTVSRSLVLARLRTALRIAESEDRRRDCGDFQTVKRGGERLGGSVADLSHQGCGEKYNWGPEQVLGWVKVIKGTEEVKGLGK